MADLEHEFLEDMQTYAKLSTKMLTYPPTRVYQLMQEYGKEYGPERGAVETARNLIQKPNTSGLTDLALVGQEGLEISIEWLVLQDKYRTLFTPQELSQAYTTLWDHGFKFPAGFQKPASP